MRLTFSKSSGVLVSMMLVITAVFTGPSKWYHAASTADMGWRFIAISVQGRSREGELRFPHPSPRVAGRFDQAQRLTPRARREGTLSGRQAASGTLGNPASAIASSFSS
jgi:hypothetical protein